jgi:hypothetical protein
MRDHYELQEEMFDTAMENRHIVLIVESWLNQLRQRRE